MLDVLVASRAPRSLLPRWVSGSLVLHLARRGWADTPCASSAGSRSASWSGSSRPSRTWRCDADLRSA